MKDEFPATLEMAKTLAAEVGKWVKSGAEITDQNVAKERLAVCAGCEFFKDGRCQVCGCFMKIKAAMKSASCPKGRWSS